jgi:hypothetical protein
MRNEVRLMVPIEEPIPEMRELGLLWQMIESSAAIRCPHDIQAILTTLVQTRERFDELQRWLVRSFAKENLAQLLDELHAKARGAIATPVCKLFERTHGIPLCVDFLAFRKCTLPREIQYQRGWPAGR